MCAVEPSADHILLCVLDSNAGVRERTVHSRHPAGGIRVAKAVNHCGNWARISACPHSRLDFVLLNVSTTEFFSILPYD